jgi:signal transduction histidine kinase
MSPNQFNDHFYTGSEKKSLFHDANEIDLDHSNSLLRSTIESTQDGVLVVDRLGKITICNKIFAKMWQIPEHMLSSKDDQLLISFVLHQLKDPETFLINVQKVYKNPSLEICDILEFKDRRVFERYCHPQKLGTEIVGTVWCFRDITEKRRNQYQANFLCRASESLSNSLDFSETLTRIGDLVVPELSEGCLVYLQKSSQELSLVACKHIEPKKCEILNSLKDRFPIQKSGNHSLFQTLASKKSYIAANANEMRDGMCSDQQAEFAQEFTTLEIKSGVSIPLIVRGQDLGILVFLSSANDFTFDDFDISLAEEFAHRAAMGIDNARLYREAKIAIRHRQDLLAVVSHELRNSLTSVLLGAQFLNSRKESGTLDVMIARNSERILRAGNQMKRLIQDLLEQAKLEASNFTLLTRQHDVGTLLQNGSELLRALVEQAKMEILVEASEGLQVNCDQERIHQVLSNLVSNAVKFCSPRSVITLSARAEGADVLFAVKDTGIGIASEELKKVFDRYWQAKENAHRGTGLGLSISKEIIEAHGGKIWLESKLGEGTTFFFTLPKCA